MEDDNGYAGGDSSSDNESTSSSPRNGPFGGEGTDDGNVRLEHELGVDHEQADPADSDYMSESMMGSGDEYEYIGDSDIDMGYEKDPEESEVITGSYSGSTSEADEMGRLRSMFWCDSQSRQDYQDFGDVVVFDSTYKMNRYGMPFIPFVGLNNHHKTTVFGCAIVSDVTEETYVWLLQTFLRAMCQKKPKAVITDGDASMIRAIGAVLTGVWHRLCSWHIEKNMKKHLSFKSTKDFWSLLYYTTSEDTFEDRWNAFVQKWRTDRTEPWLRRMYRKKRLWAASYLSGGVFLGMKSNQRSESLNTCLHLHLDFGMTLVDLIVHYENVIVRIREAEASDDCSCSQTLAVAVTNCKAIEVAASRVFTPANFYMVQKDLKNIGGLQVFDVHDGDPRRFIVGWKTTTGTGSVDYTPGSFEETIKCSCRRMACKGLPCKHILYILKVLKLEEIPQCCVLPRFSKRARHGVPARRNKDLFAWAWYIATAWSDSNVCGKYPFAAASSVRRLLPPRPHPSPRPLPNMVAREKEAQGRDRGEMAVWGSAREAGGL
ncbi:protein FAR1-RELATED SEQUENCE 5-like [Brachypodium distachyon]|uniref:protein FAR1-RELATED SEQUENCE 5-like n=1 Tax=Brachypodium distachyon TaxID=15368 RepID=UPI00052FF506|nr:protein FAR1-RELATED SEQUENCE 5-like [Brachypodium distachyon]|eukprot:XP_010239136.1 protein FAR1-RELATED SEQUENCE 5-like [Brachypodium distachyon]